MNELQKQQIADAWRAYRAGNPQPLADFLAAAKANKEAQEAAAAKRAELTHQIILASISGDAAEARRLLDAGAPVAPVDDIDNCPLSYAATYGHFEVAELLVDRGATVKKWHYDKIFPLMEAASGGCARIIELFVKHGAEVNETDEEGLTPLHRAAMEGHTEAVRTLLDLGADLGLRTKPIHVFRKNRVNPGRTSEELARGSGHAETALLLRLRAEEEQQSSVSSDSAHAAAPASSNHENVAFRSAQNPLRAGDLCVVHLGIRQGVQVTMDFVWVPPGRFVMGSPKMEEGRESGNSDETQHRVTITKGFWLARFPVTQLQYRVVTGSDPRDDFLGSYGGLKSLPDHPLEGVPWTQACIFCRILSASERFRGQLQGCEVDLPTESEWEYACRAGTTTRFNIGDAEEDLVSAGWYTGNSEERTHSVGQLTPNRWGLYDMHGNVEEWCKDLYGSYPRRDVIDPDRPDFDLIKDFRVVRGGSYADECDSCRSASRGVKTYAEGDADRVGFRICLRVEAPPHVDVDAHADQSKASTTTPMGSPGQSSSRPSSAPVGMETKRSDQDQAPSLDSHVPKENGDRHADPQPGDEISLDLGAYHGNSVEMVFVWIPPGTFLMGSPDGERGRDSDEGPQHKVTISSGFWMAKYPVTQLQYHQVMGENPSYLEGPRHPVEQVTWEDATEFCDKLTAQGRLQRRDVGKGVRLPTEAEWEYACRAGTTTRFYAGDSETDLASVAWYSVNGDMLTHPVGEKLPNSWGLHDMHGHIWEWCQDFYGEYPDHSAVDPEGPDTGQFRVLRGGSWAYGCDYSRSAKRRSFEQCFIPFTCRIDTGVGEAGFRVCMTPVRKPPPLPPQTRSERQDTEPAGSSKQEGTPTKGEERSGASSIRFPCPQCGQHLAAPAEMAGYRISCPTCEGSIEIPRPDESASDTQAPTE